MMVISNSSPLIALSSVDQLDILFQLFEKVYIPEAVFQETVTENHLIAQRERILEATDTFLRVIFPKVQHPFERKLGYGEQGVLNLAFEMQPDIVLIDDKKARNEAKDLGLAPIFTTDLFKWAKSQKIIDSYQIIMNQLSENQIYLPE